MYQRYETNFANEVHQLVVSVSRHFYVTSTGKFLRQRKPFEARLDNPETFTKRHIVHYLIRDHFSGLFYTEVTDITNIFSVFEFLYRAWSKKETHPLYGLPRGLTVPKNVRAVWPMLVLGLEEANIQPIDVTSGFQGGIRDLRTWEEELRCGFYASGFPPDYEEVLQQAPLACTSYNLSEFRGTQKAKLWRKHLPVDVCVPSSKEALMPKERRA